MFSVQERSPRTRISRRDTSTGLSGSAALGLPPPSFFFSPPSALSPFFFSPPSAFLAPASPFLSPPAALAGLAPPVAAVAVAALASRSAWLPPYLRVEGREGGRRSGWRSGRRWGCGCGWGEGEERG